MTETGDWFEESWRYRDDVLYADHLKGRGNGTILTVPHQAFAQLGAEQVDPRWLHCGVLTFLPSDGRAGVTFVTSGLSNAWDDQQPDAASVSGLGIELRIDTASEEHWAKDVLLRLSAMQLLIGAGRFAGARLLGHGDRIRVGAQTFGEGSLMTGLLAVKDADMQIPSGSFVVLQLFAITDAERQFAAERGAEALIERLRETTSFPVNDITRPSAVA